MANSNNIRASDVELRDCVLDLVGITTSQRSSTAYFTGTKIIPATKESYRVYIGTGNQNSNIDSV